MINSLTIEQLQEMKLDFSSQRGRSTLGKAANIISDLCEQLLATMQREEELRQILLKANSILCVDSDAYDAANWATFSEVSQFVAGLNGEPNEVSDT